MRKPFRAKDLSIIGLFTAITVVFAQIAIPLPVTPMPVSFGSVAVYSTGLLLKPKHAFFTQLSYLAIGAVGMPVFGNARGGISALLGPTGGYLIVYPIMAVVVSMMSNSRQSQLGESQPDKKWNRIKASFSLCIALIILYTGGTAWFIIMSGNSLQAALVLTVYPFISLDMIKIAFCVIVIVPLRSRIPSMNS